MNENLQQARKIISNPQGIAFTEIIVKLSTEENACQYLGIAKVPLKFRVKLAKIYNRKEWLNDYKTKGRDNSYDKERHRARQRFAKTQNVERGTRNDWLLRSWINRLWALQLISNSFWREVMNGLDCPVTYMEIQDYWDEVKRIANENNVKLPGKVDWNQSMARKSLTKK